MGAFSLFENLHKAKYCCSLSVKKFCLEQFLLNDFCYKQFLLKNLLSCFTMYSILEKAMWTIVAALLLFTRSDGAPGWYPTEAPTTEDLAPEDPMTTTATWQREAFKVVGDEGSAGPEGDDVAVELFNMQHTTVAVDAKQNEQLQPSVSELGLPADREKDFLPKMTFPDIPTEDDLS